MVYTLGVTGYLPEYGIYTLGVSVLTRILRKQPGLVLGYFRVCALLNAPLEYVYAAINIRSCSAEGRKRKQFTTAFKVGGRSRDANRGKDSDCGKSISSFIPV